MDPVVDFERAAIFRTRRLNTRWWLEHKVVFLLPVKNIVYK